MRAIKQYLWVGALVFGLAFVGLGGFLVVKGFEAKELVKAELATEQVVTSQDAAIPGVPVQDARTAQAQADVIKKHSYDRYGTFSSMQRDDPNRNTYLQGLTLRNSLGLAVLSFGVADLAIGTGGIVLLLGLATLAVQVPALYVIREAEPRPGRLPSLQPSRERTEAIT